jgi:hypothetical protein
MQPPFFDSSFIVTWLRMAWGWLSETFLSPVHIVYTAMQMPALVGTGFTAWWIHDFAQPWLARHIQARMASDYGRHILLTLISLIFPLLWLIGLAIAGSVAVHFGWPNHWIRSGIHLLAAWIAIRLFSMLVREPVWARAMVIAAYSIATIVDPASARSDSGALRRIGDQSRANAAVAADRAEKHVLLRNRPVGSGAGVAGAGAATGASAQPHPFGASPVRQAAQRAG